ncbi:uncharacterized protein [Spinacia oleracea]|uniref:Retrotransposon Copia-like N-terminal domain-containing protein n=1 Tax=Spinacia oleracea TaxID=3562 RepID=A0ABM3QQY4_SPIOL|nr:uncharacterized protein LOC130461652 [Spinacia oleracea]
MSNLTKLEFVPLDITGKNYLSWVSDAEIHLDAKDLGETIKQGNKATSQNKAKAMIFLRHHLHETQYREKGFKKYFELVSCLLVAEQNNELLMKNHKSRPTGSTPFPKANVTSHNGKEKYHANNSGRGRGQGRGRERGYRYGRGRGRCGSFKNSYPHQK